MTNTTPRTLCEAFQHTKTVRPEQIAIRTSDARLQLTWAEYGQRVEAAARGLYALGVRRGEPVAFLLTNRPEFHIVDAAAVHLGAVPFSMYATLAPEQIAHQLVDSGARVVICEAQFADKLRAATIGGSVQYFICVDARLDAMFTLAQLETFEVSGFDFESTWRAVQPHDTLTLVYTSGTTGPPKAVELSHANLLAELHGMAQIMPLGFDDSLISYLSDAHMGNRWGVHYTSMRYGTETITLADAKQLVATLAAVHPTYFGAVPYIWYKIKAAVQAAIAAQPDQDLRAAALRAIEIGTTVAWLRNAGEAIPAELSAAHAHADERVLAPLRSRLGLDRARFTTSGAAALDPDAVAFLTGLGLNVCEMWGMTEAAAAVTANPPAAVRFGTVGRIVPGCGEIKVADDGELLVRGPLVMKGYRDNADKTAEVIDPDGWLHTGDIGSIDAEGYVRILDRKKELIINSGGKNMSPANIEGAVKAACPLIGSVVAIGESKPYVTALIVLDPDAAAAYAARTGLTDTTPGALANDPGLREVIAAGIETANAKLARVEQIKKFQILPVVWEAGGDELTPTLKLKRNIISAKYSAEIEQLYVT